MILRNLFLILLAALIGATVAWKAMNERTAEGQFKKNNAITKFMQASQNVAKNIRSDQFRDQFKNIKFTILGQVYSFDLKNKTWAQFIKTEPRARRALFVYFLFLAHVWVLPLLISSRQRRLKQELFDLYPHLIIDHLSEAHKTPLYTTTFMRRVFYMSYPGSFFIMLAFISPLFSVILSGLLLFFAFVNYQIRIQKYLSLKNFLEAVDQGDGKIYYFKQLISFFKPEKNTRAFDRVYMETLSKAHKKKSERKAG